MKNTEKINTRDLVTLSLFVAMSIILSRFLSISTPIVRIGFSFLPITVAAIMYGTKYTVAVAAISDIIGTILFASDFFPGFTITACITAMIYGKFLYEKPKSIKNITTTVIMVNIVELLLNTVNIYILTGQPLWTIISMRSVQSVIMLIVKIFIIYNVSYSLASLNRYIPAYNRSSR
ncbi:folate family ECF transporter S component [Peptacetobacter hominis]|uniref:Folate family ECF transporter S component n=1 Tax=Peptacetobacter hominis TaxID=2743610 RepID=A0A544QVM5_9FIRM|nr:folate family ECF transporter S component [Peptacetobacter hominis]TQQ84738.1 folate family ECF transporter S component [Peptacetobacter hominis]